MVTDVLNELSFAYELVLIDDGSKDGTWAALEAASQSYDSVKAIHFSHNFGKEAAICAGLDYVSGDCTILMDGDLQHPPSYIPEMIRLWAAEGYEVVEGVKAERQTENVLRWAANTFYKLFRWLGGFDLQNASDFKLLDKSRSCLAQSQRTHHFFRGLSAWLGFKRTTFEFEVGERTVGRSKWSLRNLIHLSSSAVTSFSARPLQIITILGGLCVVGALIMIIQTLVMYISKTGCLGIYDSNFTSAINRWLHND